MTQAIQKTFNYEGNAITFQTGNGVMVNATEMAAQFGKRPIAWLQTQQTQEFLTELSKVRKMTLADLVIVSKGGNNSGTWMHEDVALEFARWLSPKFAIWCNDRIKELLTQGQTSLTDDEVLIMAKALKYADAKLNEQKLQIASQEKMIAAAEREIDRQRVAIDEQKPKADYFDNVLQSNTTYNLTEISKDLGFQSVHKFCEWARMHGIIYKQSNGVHKEWMPTSRWSGKGWFTTRTSQFLYKDGTIGSTMQTVVTESGRVQLHIFHTRTTKTA